MSLQVQRKPPFYLLYLRATAFCFFLNLKPQPVTVLFKTPHWLSSGLYPDSRMQSGATYFPVSTPAFNSALHAYPTACNAPKGHPPGLLDIRNKKYRMPS